ncbi:MAG: amidohydrolase [Planctomycetota bacterium]
MGTTLYYNGTVITLDGGNSIGTCLLIKGNEVQGVYDSPDECKSTNNLRMVDLLGKTIIPGFNDNHMHLNFLGDSLESLHFHDRDEQGIVTLLEERFQHIEKNKIVFGYDWDYPACKDPRKEILDEAFPHNPVILSQYGGHNLWVNSITLAKMKIDRDTTDPADGIISRDENGNPTGILKDLQNNGFLNGWVIGRLVSFKENRKNYLRALKECSGYGITSVQDNTWSFVAMRVILRLFRQGELAVRLSCWSLGESALFRLLFDLQKFNKQWFSRGPAKYFIDGTFSGHTAWLKESYPGTDGNHGIGKSKEQISRILQKQGKRKQQCAFHAVGDRAVSEFLDSLEALSGKYNNLPGLRIRLEHAQLISPEDIPRIKKLGVLVCAQPSALNNPEKDKAILGEDRAKRAYPYRSLLDAGVPLSFGSDAPGEKSFNPFVGIHYAVNRDDDERISLMEALKCYTSASAYAEFKEKEKGSLSPGMAADFLVLSENLLTLEERKIKDIHVEKTFMDGVMVYESP